VSRASTLARRPSERRPEKLTHPGSGDRIDERALQYQARHEDCLPTCLPGLQDDSVLIAGRKQRAFEHRRVHPELVEQGHQDEGRIRLGGIEAIGVVGIVRGGRWESGPLGNRWARQTNSAIAPPVPTCQ
jgi:hypothetical protein